MDITRSNTILYCKKWTDTVAFYRDVLGLRQTKSTDWFVEFTVTTGAALSVADEARTTVTSAGGAGITMSFRVPDVDEAHTHFQFRGIQPGPIRTIWGSRGFFVFDPEGNRLEFWS